MRLKFLTPGLHTCGLLVQYKCPHQEFLHICSSVLILEAAACNIGNSILLQKSISALNKVPVHLAV